ncbi:MAG: hypothetical protein EA001_14660 [Oscillatoriales cyanobacterium]|nr:MAG: hypothetical protein EA001_14660 [Oscillatoriales cyanobacterium]
MIARSTAAEWLAYFQANHVNSRVIDWQNTQRFCPTERQRLGHSIAIFQLGEGSEGHRLMKAMRTWAAQGGDQAWVEVLKWFIREEQRHAADLGRLLDHEGWPRLRSHWLDSAFRRLRGGWNLEMSLSILLIAEIVGLLYTRALQRATDHPIAQAVAAQIAWDESQHLLMQSCLLGLLRQGRSPRWLGLTRSLHRSLLWVTLRLVWPDHRCVFRAAGWSFAQFVRTAMTELDRAIDPSS